MPRGFFFEYARSVTQKLKYRYTCECCAHATPWIETEFVQTAKMLNRMKIRRMNDQILSAPENMGKTQAKAQKTLRTAVRKINNAISPEHEYTLLPGDPFLVQIFNEIFAAGAECPECGSGQSWYPAHLKPLADYDVFDIKARIKDEARKPEIKWGRVVLPSELPSKLPNEPGETESFSPPGMMGEVLSRGVSRGDYEDFLLQICDKLNELSEQSPPVYITELPIDVISVAEDKGLTFGDFTASGQTVGDSVAAVMSFIAKTSGEHGKRYQPILNDAEKYETLDDLKTAIERVSMSVFGRNAAILMLIVMVAFLLRRLYPRVISPLLKMIRSFFE